MPALMTYAAGKAADVATTTGPLAGMTWGQIAQANINLWAASQSTANQGNRQGGWRYVLGGPTYDSDMSTTQWGILSLIYDETLGATTPAIVRTDLAKWLAVAQNAVNHRRPGMNVLVLNRQIRTQAKVNELVLTREKPGFDVAESAMFAFVIVNNIGPLNRGPLLFNDAANTIYDINQRAQA